MAVLPKPHWTEVIYAISLGGAVCVTALTFFGAALLWAPISQTVDMTNYARDVLPLVYSLCAMGGSIGVGFLTGIVAVVVGFRAVENADG